MRTTRALPGVVVGHPCFLAPQTSTSVESRSRVAFAAKDTRRSDGQHRVGVGAQVAERGPDPSQMRSVEPSAAASPSAAAQGRAVCA